MAQTYSQAVATRVLQRTTTLVDGAKDIELSVSLCGTRHGQS